MTEISMEKQYQTRDGHPVRIIATDMKGAYNVVGLIEVAPGDERVVRFTREGKCSGFLDGNDLVEVPETLEYEFYVTVEPWDLDGLGYKIHRSMSAAQEYADGINVMAVIKCKGTFEEGDGLEGEEGGNE